MFEHPDQPDNISTGLTNGVNLRPGNLVDRPIEDKECFRKPVWKTVLIFTILFDDAGATDITHFTKSLTEDNHLFIPAGQRYLI